MSKQAIVGREYERKKLDKAFDSKKAEFIAVYGRRRVGKTYLIRNFFLQKNCVFFQNTGIQKMHSSQQIAQFTQEIERAFYGKGITLQMQRNWMDVFRLLTHTMENQGEEKKIVLFFDEFPWMATQKGKLLQALEYYWNRFWVNMPNVKLIICGSAASWIIKNILNNKGGLHNRVTMRLPIEPFSLVETKHFLKNEGIQYDNNQALQLYMCIGGIPYYLSMAEKGLSAIQNVNQMCFQKNGSLYDEFKNLFSSLFTQSKMYEELIELIVTKREGMSREEIEAKISYRGGRLSARLEDLEQAGFIISFMPWNRTKRGKYYKVIDEYTLFYLTWIAPKAQNRIGKELNLKYWDEVSQTPAWKSWAGYAFETLCFKHIESIKKALHIPEGAEAISWRYVPIKNKDKISMGAQIDLLFDRNDGIVNLCEIKCTSTPFKIDKEYAQVLINKQEIYQKVTKTQKQIFISMITSSGLAKTMYSEELIASAMTLNDFFGVAVPKHELLLSNV